MILQKAAVCSQRYPHLIIDPFFLAALSGIYSQLQGSHRNMESSGRRRYVAGMLLQNTGDLGLAEVGSLPQVRVCFDEAIEAIARDLKLLGGRR